MDRCSKQVDREYGFIVTSRHPRSKMLVFLSLTGDKAAIIRNMIYITQLIYLKERQEKAFLEFEDIAIPIISKYNGKLLLRVRPHEDSFIETHIDKPYEIHLVQFDSDKDVQDFMHDEERKKFLHLKEQSIKSSILIQGMKI